MIPVMPPVNCPYKSNYELNVSSLVSPTNNKITTQQYMYMYSNNNNKIHVLVINT